MYIHDITYKYNGSIRLTKFEKPKGFLLVTLKGLVKSKNPFDFSEGNGVVLPIAAVPVLQLQYPTSAAQVLLTVYLPENEYRQGFNTLFLSKADDSIAQAEAEFERMTNHMCVPVRSLAD